MMGTKPHLLLKVGYNSRCYNVAQLGHLCMYMTCVAAGTETSKQASDYVCVQVVTT